MAVRTIEWRNGRVVMLDQRLLPTREVYRVYSDHQDVARAIKDMVVRGAPAIGVAAAMGIALGVRTLRADAARDFDRICRCFAATRPTAVNLFWAIERMRRAYTRHRGRRPEVLREILRQEALAIHAEDIAANRALGAHGARLIPASATVLTHCNGDVANKIGTYALAVLADRHGVPFYVAAPTSSIDLRCKTGRAIPIEERSAREVTHVGDRQLAPTGVRVSNPAFDITPHELVTA